MIHVSARTERSIIVRGLLVLVLLGLANGAAQSPSHMRFIQPPAQGATLLPR